MKKKEVTMLAIEAATVTGFLALTTATYMVIYHVWDGVSKSVWTGMKSGADKICKKLTGEETRLPL